MASSCKKGYYFCNTSQECKKIPRGHKVQSDGELVREYVSDWRSDLQELAPSQQGLSTLADRKKIQKGFDNLPQFMPKTTTTTKNGKTSTSSTMVSREAETKRQLDKVGPVAGVKVKMDSDGNVPDGGAFAKAQMSKALNNVKPNSKFSASNIETAKRFNQNNTERMVNSATPGTWQFRADIATDEINQATQGARTKANKNKGRIRNVVTNNEELQGGVSVEPYTKDTKFLEVETVDIIKPKALNASNWRSDLEIVEEGNNLSEAYLNEFNQLRDFVDEMVSAGCSSEEIYNCLIEEHELREDAVLKVLSEKGGFFKGAIDGLRKIPGAIKSADQFGRANAPKVWNFLKNVDSKARPIVKSGIEKTKRAITGADQWGRKNLPPAVERGKKDLKKVSDFTQQAYASLEKNVGQPLLTKGKGDIAKWKKTQEVIRRANSLARSKAEKAGKIVDISPKTTNLPQAKKSLPLTKNVTKDMSPKEIRSKGMNLLAKLQGKTPKQQKAKELTNRMSKAVDSSKKPTTYSGQVDAALKKPDPGAIVKSSSSAVTAVKPSLDTTKGINMSLSSMASKVKNLLTGTKSSKQITGTKATKQITGTKTPNVLTGTKTKQLELPISNKKKFNPAKAVRNTIIGVTGAKVGGDLINKDRTTAIDPPNKNKAIVDTEKKKVNPEKNPVVSKVVDTYKTGKETKSKDLNPWGRSKQYTAKDGTVVDRSDVFTKAAFDFGPNIKKGEKLGVMGHGQRKKYDLEATRRKSVKESATLVKQLPKGFKSASKLKDVVKSKAIQKVFGAAMTGIGAAGTYLKSKKKDDVNITPRNLKNLENAVFRGKTDRKLDNEIRRQRKQKETLKKNGDPTVAKKQVEDANKNAPRDEKIQKAVEFTKKGTMERFKELKKANIKDRPKN